MKMRACLLALIFCFFAGSLRAQDRVPQPETVTKPPPTFLGAHTVRDYSTNSDRSIIFRWFDSPAGAIVVCADIAGVAPSNKSNCEAFSKGVYKVPDKFLAITGPAMQTKFAPYSSAIFEATVDSGGTPNIGVYQTTICTARPPLASPGPWSFSCHSTNWTGPNLP
jgi:hypothetical protein